MESTRKVERETEVMSSATNVRMAHIIIYTPSTSLRMIGMTQYIAEQVFIQELMQNMILIRLKGTQSEEASE